jgi:hypothetical protein
MRQKKQELTSASWLRPVCYGFHNLIRFNCASFFASCRRHRVLTVTCLDAFRCAAYRLGKSADLRSIMLARHLGYYRYKKRNLWFVCLQWSHRLDDWWIGVRFQAGTREFFSTCSRPPLRSIQPPFRWVLKALREEVNRPECEAHHSSPSSIEVKNVCSYTSTPLYTSRYWCYSFTFYLTVSYLAYLGSGNLGWQDGPDM